MSQDNDQQTEKIQDQEETAMEAEALTEIEKIKQECEEYKAGWMRAQADYQNLQKEVESKRGEWIKMSEVQILEDFIPIYDNFKKAYACDTNDIACNTNTQMDANYANNANIEKWNNWKQGIGYIMKQFSDVLRTYNIEEIKTVGEMFNPELHEAVGEEEVDPSTDAQGKIEEGIIVREVDGGYIVREKVLKVAKVILSKEK